MADTVEPSPRQHDGAVTTYREIFALREFRALFAATSTSVICKMMEVLAVSALVYAQTGSPLLASIAYLGGFLPQAVGAFTLLSFADRLPPRLTLATWSLVHAVAVAVLATGVLPIWGMLALLMTLGLGDPVVGAIANSVVVDVVPDGAFVLGRSVLNVSIGAMQIVGYAAGGLFLALASPAGAMWSAAAIGVVTATTFRLGLRRRPARVTGRASVGATWRGNVTLFGDPVIRRLLLAQWLPTGLIVGVEAMFVPFAGRSAGALFAAAAAGMLLGDIVVGRWTGPRLRSRLALPLFVLLAAPYLVFLTSPGLILATVLVVLASIGYAGVLTLQERLVSVVPGSLLGHGLGLAHSGQMTTQATCAIVVGWAAEFVTTPVAMTLAASVSLIATATLLVRPWPAPSVAGVQAKPASADASSP